LLRGRELVVAAADKLAVATTANAKHSHVRERF
jgi:hypothetical protein